MAYAENMTDEQQPASPAEFVQYAVQARNLAEEMDEGQLGTIAKDCLSDYDMDKESMSEWLDQMKDAIELAKLVKKDKEHPFKGAANIKYPLITQAALQFNARSYPAIVPPDRVVKAKVWGTDQQGLKAARADRISEHMSWQLSAQITEWEEETDNLLVQLPIVGTMFRKWWLDPVENRARCRLVAPGAMIVNANCKNITLAPRLSEELPLYPDEIETRIRSGQFIEFEYDNADEDSQNPEDFIEQHTRLDLDEDGYEEPYIVTIHKDSAKVVRIVADFQPEDVSFEMEAQPVIQSVPMQGPFGVEMVEQQVGEEQVPVRITAIRRGSHFSVFRFMPAMDGGFFGTGLGLLLGDISKSVNSIINMMLDAGHYASLGGGFIGGGLRLKGGQMRMRPGEYKMLPDTGGAIRDNIVEKTFPGADAVLFQMLGVLIDSGKELASTQAIMSGDDGGKNMQPTTVLALIDQGMQVFTAVYKRIFRSLKGEFRLLADINAETVGPEEYNAFHDDMDEQGQPVQYDPREEYGFAGMDVQPVADPNTVIKMAERAKAQVIMQLVEMGMLDGQASAPRVTDAMGIEDVEELLPRPDPMQQQIQMQMMQMQMAAAQAELVAKQVGVQKTLAEIEETQAQTMERLASAQTEAAQVDLQERAQALEAMKVLLEDENKRLATVFAGLGRLETASGNGASARSDGRGNRGPEAADIRAILGGQPGPGTPQAGGFGGGGLV